MRNILENTEKPVLVDPSGNALPPCIIMERVESLDVWEERTRPEFSKALAVCLFPSHRLCRHRVSHIRGVIKALEFVVALHLVTAFGFEPLPCICCAAYEAVAAEAIATKMLVYCAFRSTACQKILFWRAFFSFKMLFRVFFFFLFAWMLQAVKEVAGILSILHSLGYVHSDLRPSAVMWVPSKTRWTILGLGNVARKGSDTPLAIRTNGTGIAYAAPEALTAVQRGALNVPATPSYDAWAFGVLVFELLTGRSLIEMSGGRDEVTPPPVAPLL